MADRVRVRELRKDEGNRLPRILGRGKASVVTWRRAHLVAHRHLPVGVEQPIR